MFLWLFLVVHTFSMILFLGSSQMTHEARSIGTTRIEWCLLEPPHTSYGPQVPLFTSTGVQLEEKRGDP